MNTFPWPDGRVAAVSLTFDFDAESVWLVARLLPPKKIAAVVCFLASDDASYVTGAERIADGGYMCR